MKRIKRILIGAIFVMCLAGCSQNVKEFELKKYYYITERIQEMSSAELELIKEWQESDAVCNRRKQKILTQTSKEVGMKDGQKVKLKGYYKALANEAGFHLYELENQSGKVLRGVYKAGQPKIEDGQYCEVEGTYDCEWPAILRDCEVTVVR